MKILIQSKFQPSVGGIETLTAILVENLLKSGHAVSVSTDVPPAEEDLYKGAAVIYYKPGPFKLLKLWKKNDVVLHMTVGLKFVWPMMLCRTPCVFSHHGPYWPDLSGRRNLQEKLKLRIAKGNPWNICVSEFIRDVTGLEQSVVIHNSYDEEVFRLEGDFEREGDIIFVGRLVSDKGVHLILDAVARCFKGSSLRVTIVGGGPEEPFLRQQVVHFGLEGFHFKGVMSPEEVAEQLRRHKIIVVPSLCAEAFGIVALEGMASGAVPVVADIGGLPEAVGEAGIMFRHGDSDHLATILSALIGDSELLDSLRQRARSHVAQFSVQNMYDAYVVVLEDAIKSARH